MPNPEQWQALADAIDAYDDGEDSPDPEKRGPVNLAIRAIAVVRAARAVLDAHDEEEVLGSAESLGPA